MGNREDRTRRLIQIGAMMEKYLGIKTIEQAKAFGQIACADPIQLENWKRQVKIRVQEIN
jgi:hypothetical protein